MAKAARSAVTGFAKRPAAAACRTRVPRRWRPTTISANLPARILTFAPHGPKSADIYVGRELLPGNRGGEKIHYGGGLHQVIFGPSNVGKGMRLLAPNLLSVFGKSIVVIDPKGQLAAMTALYRKHMGDDVHIIDPFGVVAAFVRERPDEFWPLAQAGLIEDAGFNPLAQLDPDSPDFYDEAASIAMALIRVDTKEPHWPESARALVTGFIMWARIKHGRDANLVQVRQWLTEADAWEEWENIDDEGKVTTYRQQVAGLRATALEMVHESGHYAVRDLAGRFTTGRESKELDSIRSAADTNTRWLLSAPLRKSLAKNTIDLRRLKKGDRCMTIYAVLPAKYIEDHSIWLRLFVSSAIRASLQSDRGWKVLFVLDEFPVLGPLEIIQRQWGVARDYGIAFWAVLQDLGQMQAYYPKHYRTMLSSTGCIQSFRTGDETTAEWVSKRSGPDTVAEYSWNEGGSAGNGRPSNSHSLSVKSIEKPTIRAHWLYGMPDDVTVTYFAQFGQPAMLKMPHLMTQLTSLRERSLANPYYYGPQHTALTKA